MENPNKLIDSPLSKRFRGFLPIVVDVETAGFNPKTDALLEIAAVTIDMDEKGYIFPDKTYHHHIQPFPGAILNKDCLEFTGIDPYHPFRFAVEEKTAFLDIFQGIRKALKQVHCHRAILVGHNPFFDMGFVKAAVQRCEIKRNPFHPFSTIDTGSLSALTLGQTVLAKAIKSAKLDFDVKQAHCALYDAQKTAELFCYLVNRWQDLGGWNARSQMPMV